MFSGTAKQRLRVVTPDNSSPDDSLRVMVDACVSNVAVLDESGSVIYASKAWDLLEQNFAVKPGAAPLFQGCTRSTEAELDPTSEISLADDIQSVLVGKQTEFHHQYHFHALPESRPFVMHAARLDLPGRTFRVLITHEELSSVRESFKESKERLLEFLGTKILAWEGEVERQQFTYVSEHAVEMLGYPVGEWYEPDFLASHIHADDQHRVMAAYHKQTRLRDHFDLTFRMWSSDGRLVWVQNLISVDAGTRKLHGFMIDVSERKRAEEALKALGGRLIAAQEEERRRVARELHDDFNQRLAVLSIELEQLGQKIQKPLRLRRSVQHLQDLAQEIAAEIHRLSYKLHPSKLDHLGLIAAVKSLCAELSESGKLKVDFQQTGFPFALDRDTTLCLFRIAQEGLRNCIKHSRAESARVVLTRTRDAVRLSVSDNGCGFNTKSALMEKGLGFISMKERLHILGGEMNVYSKPLHGTRIEVSVPLKLDSNPQGSTVLLTDRLQMEDL
jgi:PAS domain S-box-containing protein